MKRSLFYSMLTVFLLPVLPAAAVGAEEALQMDVTTESEIASGYLCRGRTICDGWMNIQGLYLDNLRYNGTYLPLYAGYWGAMHLEKTPEEHYEFGKYSEIDYWLGVDYGRYLDENLIARADVIVCGLPEDKSYDAMTGVDVDTGYRCWFNPKLHLRNRVLNAGKGKIEACLSAHHRWDLPHDFWTRAKCSVWYIDRHNDVGRANLPGSGFSSLIPQATLGWKCLYCSLDCAVPLDDSVLPSRRSYHKRWLFGTIGVQFVF